MDKVILKGLELFAFHGVNPEEKENGQRFVMDITAGADLSAACKSDNVGDTVSYSAMRKTAEKAFLSGKFDLIERAADAVAEALLSAFPMIHTVTVKVMKPDAPMNAKFEYAAVEITRGRE